MPPKSGLYVHPEGPFTGSQLNQIPISFEKMKLSNSSSGPNGKILMLASMLKYKPRIYLIQGKVNIDTRGIGSKLVLKLSKDISND